MQLRTWNSPAVNAIHAVLVAMNIAAGAILGHYARMAHQPFHPWINYMAVGLIIIINIYQGITRNRRLIQQVNEIGHGMTTKAILKAKNNLMRAVKVTGAKYETDLMRVTLRLNKNLIFEIYPGYVVQRRGKIEVNQTCYYLCAGNIHRYEVPRYEHMATALLLLKNNPEIFEKWARRDGRGYV